MKLVRRISHMAFGDSGSVYLSAQPASGRTSESSVFLHYRSSLLRVALYTSIKHLL